MNNFLQLIVENAHLARRLGAGSLLLLVALFVFLPAGNGEAETKTFLQQNFLSLTAPLILVGYFLGSILEVVGDVLISRLWGAAAATYSWPVTAFSWLPGPTRHILIFVWWITVSPFAFYYFSLRAVLGKDDYKLDFYDGLSPQAKAAFAALKNTDKTGFSIPLGLNAEHALQAVYSNIDEEQRPWIDRMRHANRDVLTFATSLMFIAFLLSYHLSDNIKAYLNVGLVPKEIVNLLSIANSISLILLVMGIVFIYSKKRTIISILEAYGSDRVTQDPLVAQAVPTFNHRPARPYRSHGGRLYQWLVLTALLWVNLLNVLRWNLKPNSAENSWISETPLADLFILHSDFPGYALLTARSLQPYYSAAHWSAIYGLLIVLVACYFRRRWSLSAKRIAIMGAAVMIGYFAGSLVYDGLRFVVGDMAFRAYLPALGLPLRAAAVVVTICWVLARSRQLPAIDWPVIGRIFLMLLLIGLMVRFAVRFFYVIDREMAFISIGSLIYETGRWFAIAYVLYFFHPKKQRDREKFRRFLWRYAALVFVISLLFVCWRFGAISGLNFWFEGFYFSFGDLVLKAVAVTGLWPFAAPLIFRAKDWLRA